MKCIRCGGDMIGDGFKSVFHCENAIESTYQYHEPDANPVYCLHVTNEQLHMLRHALGLNKNGIAYRNYYADEKDAKECNELINMGLMERGREIHGGLVYYHATVDGQTIALEDHS